MSDDATITIDHRPSRAGQVPTDLGLVIVWSSAQPERVGEIAFVPRGASRLLGRGQGPEGETALVFGRQRPGELVPGGALAGRGISRRQLVLHGESGHIGFERVGRCPALLNGREVDTGRVAEGDVLTLTEQLVLLCVRRPRELPVMRNLPSERWPAFGRPDATGLIGESPAAWRMRDEVALVAMTSAHVLVLGPSGAGKEVIAGAIHRLSPRGQAPLVSRNAATLPEGLVDAELFGHVADYPQAGMAAREGLIGEADGGTLFLDEIGELDVSLQAHLLRVLDEGEYQRLGDDRRRRADLRVVAATNRDVTQLKGDFAARLKVRVHVPGLDDRREDIPLLLVMLLERAVRDTPQLRQTYDLEGDGPALLRALEPDFVAELVRGTYAFNVRELDRRLWEAIVGSTGPRIAGVAEHDGMAEAASVDDGAAVEVDVDAVRAALAAHEGNKTAAAAALGLSRFQLYRLLKRFDLA